MNWYETKHARGENLWHAHEDGKESVPRARRTLIGPHLAGTTRASWSWHVARLTRPHCLADVLVPADLGHALAHISARATQGHPWMRCVFQAACRGPSTATTMCRRSLAGELAATSAVGHALLLIASLMPLPIVDGGTLMKWTLVAHGRSATEADETVRRVDWAMVSCGVLVAAIAARRIR
jgi:hypothetical protein